MLNRLTLLTLGDTTIQPDAVISNLHELSDLIGQDAYRQKSVSIGATNVRNPP